MMEPVRPAAAWGGVVAVAALLCAVPAGAEPGPAPEPVFHVGDTFVWEHEGEQWTEEVVAVEGDLITWKASNGDMVETSANFVMPPRRFDQEAYGEGGTEVIESEGALFPLEAGKRLSVRFRYLPEGAEESRLCTVGGSETTTVPAGTFETIKVTCQEVNRTKIWHYAPDIGMFVSYLNSHRYEPNTPRVLVSFTRVDGG
jgi:hypothetical protein